MLLAIAASEGFSVAGLVRGDLTRTSLPRGVFPDRVPRRLPRIDRGRIDRYLRIALAAGATISEVAKAVSASTPTLARHEEHDAKLRDTQQARQQQLRLREQRRALRDAEAVILVSLRLGLRPTLRREAPRRSIWSLTRSAQGSLRLNGAFCPTILPFFHGSR